MESSEGDSDANDLPRRTQRIGSANCGRWRSASPSRLSENGSAKLQVFSLEKYVAVPRRNTIA